MEDVIERFLSVSYGSGSGSGNGSGYRYGDGYGYGNGNGDGSGYGYGSGYGNGSGDGDGYGNGNGYGNGCGCSCGCGCGCGCGYGNGNGYGDGSGIKNYNGYEVHMIDSIQTIIYSVHHNIARGAILQSDLTLKDCYIAKVDDSFAHGDTAEQALRDATNKAIQAKPIEDRIKDVVAKYPSLDTIVEHSELYSIHNILTGSCALGRRQFAQEHNLDPEHGQMTIREFIDLTKSAYGSENIRLLAQKYNYNVNMVQ